MPTFTKPLLIQNPASGVWWPHTNLQTLLARLKEWLPSLEIRVTRSRGDATRFARDAVNDGFDLILALGGDGTINEALNGLVGSGTPLGILPGGTGNSLAREVGLPINPLKAVSLLKEGAVRNPYLGKADGRYFALMVGIGFDADAVHRVSFRAKRMLGRISYVVSGIGSLIRYRFPSFKIVIDGKARYATTAVICKSQFYASAFRIAPEASLEKPSFQVRILNGRGPWRYGKHVFSVMTRRSAQNADDFIMEAKEVFIEPVPGIKAHMDGEAITEVPSSVRIVPEPVKVLFPTSSPG